MLDERIKLEDYFKDEITRVSELEASEIEHEIEDIRDRSIQNMELEAQHEAGIEREQVLREMMSDHLITLSKTHEEVNRKLMGLRKELSDNIFQEAVEKIKAFTRCDEYKDYLLEKAEEMAKGNFGHVTLLVSKKDEALLPELCHAYGDAQGEVDIEILIGGLRMECYEKGIVVDETFDTGIEEQSAWFYTNSGLFIK